MLIDSFVFYNELDLLEMRLAELDQYVDYFILVEATKTFQGADKPCHFLKNLHRFTKYLHKIRYVAVNDMPETDNPWEREDHQRNAIVRGIDSAWPLDTKIMLSDVDEIPDLKQMILSPTPAVFIQDMYYYYLNLSIGGWKGTMVATLQQLQEEFKTATALRHYRHECPITFFGGWHFSCMGGAQAVVDKMKAFSHTEYLHLATLENVTDAITQRWAKGLDFLNRDIYNFEPMLYPDCFNVVGRRWPIDLILYPDKYMHMLLK